MFEKNLTNYILNVTKFIIIKPKRAKSKRDKVRSATVYANPHMHWPQGYKTFFMLNSAEHEILIALQYKK